MQGVLYAGDAHINRNGRSYQPGLIYDSMLIYQKWREKSKGTQSLGELVHKYIDDSIKRMSSAVKDVELVKFKLPRKKKAFKKAGGDYAALKRLRDKVMVTIETESYLHNSVIGISSRGMDIAPRMMGDQVISYDIVPKQQIDHESISGEEHK